METNKKKPKAQPIKFDSSHYAPVFNLDFLKPQPITVLYENELLTAEEKADYYEDMVRNQGQKDSGKIAKHCRKMAAKLRKKVGILKNEENKLKDEVTKLEGNIVSMTEDEYKNLVKLKEKLAHIDPAETLPLLEKISALESLAYEYENQVSLDVLESQKDFSDYTTSFPISPEQLAALSERGLEVFKPKSHADADDGDIWIQELQKKAKFWKNIHSWGPAEQLAYYLCGPEKPADWKEAMFVRGQKHPAAFKVLCAEGRHTMMRLLQLAEMGNEDAAKEAVEQLEWFVRLLNLYAKINPAIFKKVASQLQSWPVMYSPHPRLNQIPTAFAHEIGLGKDIDFEFSRTTKWNPNDLACKIAMQLYKHIKKMRQDPVSDPHSPCLASALDLPGIKRAGAVKLWWSVAKRVLLNTYPTPEDNEVLRSLTKIKNRHKVRDKILECLENRFASLFPQKFR